MNNVEKFSEKPLLEHLTDLKLCLIKSVLSFIFFSIISYLFSKEIYGFLTQPLEKAFQNDENRRMIFTGLPEVFLTYLKLSLYCGFIFSFPIIAYQIYKFVAPGLYKKEKKTLIPFLLASPALFAAGASFVFYFLMPVAWKFFVSFENLATDSMSMPIVFEARVSEYLSLTLSLIVAFGLTFQLPIIVILLVLFNILSVEQIKESRKYALIIILIIAGFITPPDILSQILLATPLYLLYELSIIISQLIKKKDA